MGVFRQRKLCPDWKGDVAQVNESFSQALGHLGEPSQYSCICVCEDCLHGSRHSLQSAVNRTNMDLTQCCTKGMQDPAPEYTQAAACVHCVADVQKRFSSDRQCLVPGKVADLKQMTSILESCAHSESGSGQFCSACMETCHN